MIVTGSSDAAGKRKSYWPIAREPVLIFFFSRFLWNEISRGVTKEREGSVHFYKGRFPCHVFGLGGGRLI